MQAARTCSWRRRIVVGVCVVHQRDATFMRSSPGPLYVEPWESTEASIVMHHTADRLQGMVLLTGSKVLCRTLVGKFEVVQLLGCL